MQNKEIYLRLDKTSEVGRQLTHILENGNFASYATLEELGGKKRSPWLLRTLADQVDNLAVTIDKDFNHTASLIEVMGNTIKVNKATFNGNAGQGSVPSKSSIEEITWPAAPSLLDPMSEDKFIQPKWYNRMKAMVKAGRDISLEGPPSVGKDTAVMQLAATERQPLVVLGGGAGVRERHIVGKTNMVNGSTTFNVSEVAAAIVNGWWLLITEINAINPDELLFLNNITENPFCIVIDGKAYSRHPNFRMFVSYNHGLVGTKPLPQSLKSRFFPIKIDFYDENELIEILMVNGMDKIPNSEICRDIVSYAMEMWDAHVKGKIRFQISIRELKDAVLLLNIGAANTVRSALMSVVDSIDNPIEAKFAKDLLYKITKEY